MGVLEDIQKSFGGSTATGKKKTPTAEKLELEETEKLVSEAKAKALLLFKRPSTIIILLTPNIPYNIVLVVQTVQNNQPKPHERSFWHLRPCTTGDSFASASIALRAASSPVVTMRRLRRRRRRAPHPSLPPSVTGQWGTTRSPPRCRRGPGDDGGDIRAIAIRRGVRGDNIPRDTLSA